MLALYDLSVNAVKNPSFIPCEGLYIGWKLTSDRQNVYQTAYTATLTEQESGSVVWRGEGTTRSVHIPVDATLRSRTAHILTVTVRDNGGETATATLHVRTALTPSDWQGVWIKPRRHIESWAPYLRTKFETHGEIASATLYVCGLGCGEYYINGQRVSEDLLDPPFTNYRQEVLYRAYDVTPLIKVQNAFAALLGDGWYSQSRAWHPIHPKYGDVCLLCELEIRYTDGRRQTVVTNTEDWTYKYSPITLNNLYGGESYDCRLETPDFALFEGDEDGWGAVVEDTTPRGELRLCLMPPVRVIRTLTARSVRQVSGKDDGAWIVDFGENVSGVVELHIPPSPCGAQYTLRFAETAHPDGSLDLRSTGSFATQCIQQDVYIARGDAKGEVWRPRFTYHGFRYMEITGYHAYQYGACPELSIGICHVLSTDLSELGSFESDSEDLNRFQTLTTTTILSNYHGFPEDCPAREKCGWLGDAQVVCNTAIMNYDMEASYAKYLSDIRTNRAVFGTWQMIAPGPRNCGDATPLWGCATVVIPYWMYRYYRNESVVREFWGEMEAWVRHEMEDAERVGEGYVITRGLGDWCPPVDKQSPRRIPVPESSTAIFYEICRMMEELARELELPTAVDYGRLASEIKDCFNTHFWDSEHHRYSTWGTCGVALQTGLCPDGEREALLASLVRMIEDDDFAMPTGIYGNKYLVPALSEAGYGDMAMKFLFHREHLSFGTMMDDGATSLWECFDMSLPEMPRERGVSSYNHPMHAGFAYFMYAHVAGIRPLAAGFESFEIAPCRFTDISAATVRHVCPYGEIRVSFEREGSRTQYDITVPVGTTAHLRAGNTHQTFGSGRYTLTVEE